MHHAIQQAMPPSTLHTPPSSTLPAVAGDVPCEQTSRSVWRAMTRASWARLAGKVLARASALLWQAAGSVDKLREEVVRQVGGVGTAMVVVEVVAVMVWWCWLLAAGRWPLCCCVCVCDLWSHGQLADTHLLPPPAAERHQRRLLV